MADGSAQHKNPPASQREIDEARESRQVAHSPGVGRLPGLGNKPGAVQ